MGSTFPKSDSECTIQYASLNLHVFQFVPSFYFFMFLKQSFVHMISPSNRKQNNALYTLHFTFTEPTFLSVPFRIKDMNILLVVAYSWLRYLNIMCWAASFLNSFSWRDNCGNLSCSSLLIATELTAWRFKDVLVKLLKFSIQ